MTMVTTKRVALPKRTSPSASPSAWSASPQAPCPCASGQEFQLRTLSGQSGSGPLFHSILSLAPSSLFTAAHSGEMLVAVSLG